MSRFQGHNCVPDWRASRVDEGVDGTLSAAGFVAPFAMTIVYSTPHAPGWANGGYMAGRILSGPLKGQVIYVAEGITPLFGVGATVQAGRKIADRANNPYNNVFGNIEVGFANPANPGQPLAQTLQGYSGDQSQAGITAGEAYNEVIGDLGGAKGFNNSGLQPNWDLLPAQIHAALFAPVSEFPLKQGSRGTKVRQVQLALRARHDTIGTDGIYGPQTAGFVRLWQDHHGRKITGEVTQDDWDFMFPTLHPGTGRKWPGATEALTAELRRRGYKVAEPGTPDYGNYGPGMVHAVQEFQHHNGLTADGIVGPHTWAKLF